MGFEDLVGLDRLSDAAAGDRAREILTARVDDRDLAADIARRIAHEVASDVEAVTLLLFAQTTLPAVLIALVCEGSSRDPTDLLAEVYALLATSRLTI